MANSTVPQSPTGQPQSSIGISAPVVHTHPHTAITGLKSDANGRVEPAYDSINVKANGQLIALYNAATVPGSFSPSTVPFVTIVDAVKNNDGEDTTLGKAQADKFLAEGRITQREYNEITREVKPTGEGVKPGAVVPGRDSEAVTGDVSFATVLTPKGTTLGQMIKNVTFPRTIAQLDDNVQKLPRGNIVNNLAALALNVVEPIKEKYPNAFLTNSYRQGAGQSQHGTGQACDIQFRGVRAHDYYDICVWISKNIPYDQLLLEYLPSKTVWIHISYAIPNLPYGGLSVRKSKGIASTLATLNGASGGKFLPNLHADVVAAAVPNRVVAA